MHIVIMGCGRVGSTLAHSLQRMGHSVAVVDQSADAFRRLGHDFDGRRVTGVGFDRDTLIEAGVTDADGFIAVSSGDNSNVISARVARETFRVPRVVARIYDPRRADVYQKLGIPTVATVRWTADQILRKLLPDQVHTEWSDPSGKVVLVAVPTHVSWVGRPVSALEESVGQRVAFLSRLGEALLPARDTVVQDGDVVHLITSKDRLPDAERRCREGVADH